MEDFTVAAKVSDIADGSMKTVSVRGKFIAIANVGGQFFAVDDTCSHAACSLGSEGFLEGTTVTCGCHGAQFNITTGKVLSLPAVSDVAPYEVKLEAGEIWVKI